MMSKVSGWRARDRGSNIAEETQTFDYHVKNVSQTSALLYKSLEEVALRKGARNQHDQRPDEDILEDEGVELWIYSVDAVWRCVEESGL